MSFEIPDGLTDLLQDFTVSVLKERPPDLVKFAADYFNKLKEKNGKEERPRAGVRFAESEPMQTSDSDDEPMEPPPQRFTRRKSVSAERYDPEADDEEPDEKIVNPKTDEQRLRLSDAVKPIFLFRSLDPEQMHCVLDAMFERKVTVGEHVIDQGDDGDNFYVIDSGTYDIFVDNKLVGNYENRGSFGELALMYNMPRAATIIATSEGGIIWALDRLTFRRIVLKNAYEKRKVYESLLENVPMLKGIDTYERMNIADALFTRAFVDGDVIIKQGDSADCMYFVEDGEVRITVKNMNDPDSKEKEVTKYTNGMYFGELALVTHKPRAATCYAVGKTKLAVLDVQAFERLLGPCMDIMKRNVTEYEEQLVQVFGSKAAISDLR